MVRIFTDPRMLDHVPPPRHPERPERLQAILRHLDRTGLSKRFPSGEVREATREQLARVHSAMHLDHVAAFDRSGGGLIEADTWLGPGSIQAARLAAGAAIGAVEAVASGKDRRAMCLVRPPGHHARRDEPMGFCLFGNVAVVAAEALATHGLTRILVVDFDVHHGNGTQEMFYDDPRVGFLSVHRYPFYPGTGAAGETGTGAGLGFTKNIPLPARTKPKEFHAAFRAGLDTFADHVRPELVILSAGFDAHAEDPVGGLGLGVDDFITLTRDVVSVAETHAGGKIVSVLEGGYNVPILAGCVAEHLQALAERPG